MAHASSSVFLALPAKSPQKQDLFLTFIELWLKNYCKSEWHLELSASNVLQIDFKDSSEAVLFKLSH